VFETKLKVVSYYNGTKPVVYKQGEFGGNYSLRDTQAFMPIVPKSLVDKANELWQEHYPEEILHDIQNPDSVLVEFSGHVGRDIRLAKGFVIKSPNAQYFANANRFATTIYTLFFIISVILTFVTMLIISNYVSASIQSNKKLLGILRSLGVSKRGIFGILYSEGTAITIIILVVTLILMVIFMPIIGAMTYPVFHFKWWLVLIMLAIGLISTTITTIIPIKRFNKKPIISIIRNN